MNADVPYIREIIAGLLAAFGIGKGVSIVKKRRNENGNVKEDREERNVDELARERVKSLDKRMEMKDGEMEKRIEKQEITSGKQWAEIGLQRRDMAVLVNDNAVMLTRFSGFMDKIDGHFKDLNEDVKKLPCRSPVECPGDHE